MGFKEKKPLGAVWAIICIKDFFKILCPFQAWV